ncbi:unnamed protein product [Ambrosiozyma monospora]|uniref:Unnamed protein product n=1 Tax=Ambrosiozyma monospora TaxID=43982 RepID=A0ACB5T1D5_AMBMO|nr:unnamed protein product [Ambrosiozyma monospora]
MSLLMPVKPFSSQQQYQTINTQAISQSQTQRFRDQKTIINNKSTYPLPPLSQILPDSCNSGQSLGTTILRISQASQQDIYTSPGSKDDQSQHKLPSINTTDTYPISPSSVDSVSKRNSISSSPSEISSNFNTQVQKFQLPSIATPHITHNITPLINVKEAPEVGLLILHINIITISITISTTSATQVMRIQMPIL